MSAANDELIHDLRLVKVIYGSDTGLVSLKHELLLAATWDTSRVSMMSGMPEVTFDDCDATTLFGDEHSWDDVIEMLADYYDWETQELPSMKELKKHYPK